MKIRKVRLAFCNHSSILQYFLPNILFAFILPSSIYSVSPSNFLAWHLDNESDQLMLIIDFLYDMGAHIALSQLSINITCLHMNYMTFFGYVIGNANMYELCVIKIGIFFNLRIKYSHHFLYWISGVVPFNMWLISSWE